MFCLATVGQLLGDRSLGKGLGEALWALRAHRDVPQKFEVYLGARATRV